MQLLIRTIEGHKDWIYGLIFSSDDRLIASASEDRTIKIWRISDGSLVRTLKHNSTISNRCRLSALTIFTNNRSRPLVSID